MAILDLTVVVAEISPVCTESTITYAGFLMAKYAIIFGNFLIIVIIKIDL